MRDDDALDLSAWEAPPPPDGLADAVIARIGGTGVSPGMPVELPSRKRSLVIAASAAAALLVAAGVWAIVRTREHAPPADGEVVADRAQHVELGGVSVDLDRGADIRWQRSGERLHVDQKAGTAAWRVGDQHVEIAAATATIETQNANVRVEVPMNLSDARVIGASTVTAAAVAMVTVVVYEGHVQVHHGDQTVVVQPGSTYVVPQPQPAPPVVGVATGAKRIAVLGLEGWSGDAAPRELVAALRARASAGPYVLAPDSAKELVDEKLLHDCTHEEASCMTAIGRDLGADALIYGAMESGRAGYTFDIKWLDVASKGVVSEVTGMLAPDQVQDPALREQASKIFETLAGDQILPDAPDEVLVQEILAGSTDQLDACRSNAAAIAVTINGAGKAVDVEIVNAGSNQPASPCISNVIGGLAFPRSKHGGTFTRPLNVAACDVDALVEQGNGYLSVRDMPDVALAKYEAAIACKPEPRLYKLAFTAACKVKDAAKARTHWRKLSADDQNALLPLCRAQGISRDQLESVKTCDAVALAKEAADLVANKKVADALAKYEAALACDPAYHSAVVPAFMLACRIDDRAKGKLLWDKLTDKEKTTVLPACLEQQGISRADLDGATPLVCDADKLQTKGEEYIAMGQYASGLTTVEQGLACRPGDEKLTKLAFLAACKSKNVEKARTHYNQLPPNDQATYVQLCVREGITQDQLRGSPPASTTDSGTALITCNPPARVLIDGTDTGKTTPVRLELVPGKHKLTLQLGGDRFTYPLVIKAGETETISKDLQ